MSFIQRIDKAAGSLRQASRLDCMTRVIAQCPSTNCRYKKHGRNREGVLAAWLNKLSENQGVPVDP